jgi:hypothetical protein
VALDEPSAHSLVFTAHLLLGLVLGCFGARCARLLVAASAAPLAWAIRSTFLCAVVPVLEMYHVWVTLLLASALDGAGHQLGLVGLPRDLVVVVDADAFVCVWDTRLCRERVD